MKNYIQTGVVGLVSVMIGLVIGYFAFNKVVVQTVAGAPGDSYSTATSVSLQGDPTGATYGYISGDNKYQWAAFTNSSGRDRFINSIEYGATGLGTVSTSTTGSIGLTVATTSSATLGLNGNTNYIANANVISTSTGWYIQPATSTPTGSVATFATGVSRVWPTGTTIVVESPATSSASFWFRINYLGQ